MPSLRGAGGDEATQDNLFIPQECIFFNSLGKISGFVWVE
jgi:hypothetical protein